MTGIATRNFRLYWGSRAVNSFGSALSLVVLPLLVFELSGSPFLTSLTTVAETLPMVLFGVFGGAVGDLWPRRRIMCVADLVAALALASVPICDALDVLSSAVVIGAGFLTATATVFFDGANWGVIPALVSGEDLDRASARVFGLQSAMELAGPAIVGLLLLALDTPQVVLIDVVTFGCSALLIRAISTSMSAAVSGAHPRLSSIPSTVMEGLRFLRGDKRLVRMLGVGMSGSAGAGAVFSVLVPWIVSGLEVPAKGLLFGVVTACWSLGALIGGASLGRLHGSLRAVFLARRLTAACVTCCLVLSSVGWWYVAAPVLVLYTFSHTAQYTSAITLRQRIVPAAFISRVNSASRVVTYGVGTVGGALLGGLLADQWGFATTFVFAAIMHAVSSAFAWSGALANVDLPIPERRPVVRA